VLGKATTVVQVKSRLKVVKEDPADVIIVWTSFDGKVDYIVSGDKHLLALEEF
jgi:predicted nucleic acid-binding protein